MEKSLKSEGVVRVRVYCKDAIKIVGSTLVHINGHGHMLKWRSEKLEDPKGSSSQSSKNSKFDRHKDDSDEKDDKEADSTGSHDSGFARLGKE
jgi:hypothetical protein